MLEYIGTTEDELPKSLIENCKRAEPPPEEQGKYLPELFDASAFQFKGPLIIEYPKLHILEHDLTNAKPVGSNMNDHVRFDENLNIAYNIGENVEIIVKSYGKGIKIGSGEMIKENGADEDDEMNEQENDSRQSIIENGEKEIVKQSKRQITQSQEKKSGTRKVPDPQNKFKSVSDHIQITQTSRYSESSTQTLRVNDEANNESLKKQSDGTNIANLQEVNSNIGYEADKRSKPLKRASTILLEETTQIPTRSMMIMLTKEQHDTSLTEVKNITPTVQTVDSQHWAAEEINPSISGSSGSQYKTGNISERMPPKVNKKVTFLRHTSKVPLY
uniref:TFIIIC_sub6 domain-containing protein n=1 Tax=Elaeophora elaphi TaxID=1147741 RepID=A0A0R3RPM7_9BILA